MSDLINRQAAIDALWHSIECDNGGELQSYAEAVIGDAEDALKALPPAQPTLYGYSIESLVAVAEIMKKENVGPGEALQLFKSASYIAELVRAEWYENVQRQIQRQMEQMFEGGQDDN